MIGYLLGIKGTATLDISALSEKEIVILYELIEHLKILEQTKPEPCKTRASAVNKEYGARLIFRIEVSLEPTWMKGLRCSVRWFVVDTAAVVINRITQFTIIYSSDTIRMIFARYHSI